MPCRKSDRNVSDSAKRRANTTGASIVVLVALSAISVRRPLQPLSLCLYGTYRTTAANQEQGSGQDIGDCAKKEPRRSAPLSVKLGGSSIETGPLEIQWAGRCSVRLHKA